MESVLPAIQKAHKSKHALADLSEPNLKKLLVDISQQLLNNIPQVLLANKNDIDRQDANNPKNDRLLLTESRIKSIAKAIKQVAKLPDPTGKILTEKTLANGLKLTKVSVALGVVAAIYESRPNVTYDIAALCLRSRNVAVLKGSKDAEQSNLAAIKIIHSVLRKHGLPTALVTLLPAERESVAEMFTATKLIDVIIPRGSEGLIKYVRENSLVPVIETGAGVCHVYVHEKANFQKALDIVVNAKVSRPSVCNAMDCLIIDQQIAASLLPAIATSLAEHEVEIFADAKAYKIIKGYPYLKKADLADFGREYISLKCAIKVVDNIDKAIEHINTFGTRHSEAIVSDDKKACEKFIKLVDAAAVYSNASTRFTDGEVFELGAEIGISTQKLHARGPFALEKLVTEKWILRGNGQVRK